MLKLRSVKEIFFDHIAQPIIKNKNYLNKNPIFHFTSYGNKNPYKIFYIIKRTPGAGFFSNLTYVLGHLEIAKKYNFTPVVDMENYPTIYNEKKLINKTYNSWEYYFKKVSKYKLNEVYKSKNVIITSNFFLPHMSTDMSLKKELRKLIKEYIHIRPEITKEVQYLKQKYFRNNNKILGIHFRGTTYKTARGHAFPIPLKLMKENIDALIKKFNYNKIFVVTEEDRYLKYLKQYYPKKIIFCDVYRTKKTDAFKHYPRINHRYKLGREILVETLLLSCCSGLTFVKSNVSSAAITFSTNKLNLHPLFIGYNSRNKYISKWYWYLKKILPNWMGGFKINLKY